MELSSEDVRVISESLELFAVRNPDLPLAASAAHSLALSILSGKSALTSDELDAVVSTLRCYRDELDDQLDMPEYDRTEVLTTKKAVNAVLRKIRKTLQAQP